MSDDPHQRRRDARDRVKAREEALAYIIALLRAFRVDADPNDENAYRFPSDIPYWNRMTQLLPWTEIELFMDEQEYGTWIEEWIDDQVGRLQLEHSLGHQLGWESFETWQEYEEYLHKRLRLDAVAFFRDETEP